MKKYSLWFFMLLNVVLYMDAQPQEQFLRANCAYKAQEYARALTLYQEINPKGRAVWYNMGNCAYHLKQYIEALCYWTRAQKNASWIEYQDSVANKMSVYAQCDIHYIPRYWIETWGIIPWKYSWFLVQCIILSLVLFLCICWYLLYARWQRYVLVVMYGLMCVSAYCLYEWNSIHNKSYALVRETTQTYIGPDIRCHRCTQIPYATQVAVLESHADWAKIENSGVISWIKTASLLVI